MRNITDQEYKELTKGLKSDTAIKFAEYIKRKIKKWQSCSQMALAQDMLKLTLSDDENWREEYDELYEIALEIYNERFKQEVV